MSRNYLSKRLALKICYELWTWLAQNPGEYKYDWPGWEKYVKYTQGDNFKQDCPCCEWIWQQKGLSADNCFSEGAEYCPLKTLWPQGCETRAEEAETPWELWLLYNLPSSPKVSKQEATKQAQIIVFAAYEEWQKLENKRK